MFSSSPLLSAPRFSQVTLVNQYNCEGLGPERKALLKILVNKIKSMRKEYPYHDFIVTLKNERSLHDSLALTTQFQERLTDGFKKAREENPGIDIAELEEERDQIEEFFRAQALEVEQQEADLKETLPDTSLPFYLSFRNNKDPKKPFLLCLAAIEKRETPLPRLDIYLGETIRQFLNKLIFIETPERFIESPEYPE